MKLMDDIRHYLDGLEPRERHMLLTGVAAIALTLAYLVIIEPMQMYRQNLASQVAGMRETVSWMRGAAEQLGPQRGPQRETVAAGSLLATVDAAAKRSELGRSLKRITQDAGNSVRVRLEGASFDSLLLWLEGLEQRYGIRPSDVSVERTDATGQVNATLTLEGPSA